MAKIPAMAKSQLRLLQGVPTDKDLQQAVVQSAANSNLPATPAQIIMNNLSQYIQRQEALKAQQLKTWEKELAMKNANIAEQYKAMHAQVAAQKQQIVEQIKAKQREEMWAQLQPKQTIQNGEQIEYLDDKKRQALEMAYLNRPIPKKTKLNDILNHTMYRTNLRPFQGGFVDPNYDSQMRPLGQDTNKIIDF